MTGETLYRLRREALDREWRQIEEVRIAQANSHQALIDGHKALQDAMRAAQRPRPLRTLIPLATGILLGATGATILWLS